MVIDAIAQELIKLKTDLGDLEARYQRKRDEMYNSLATQVDGSYVFGGFKFQRTEKVTVVSVNKQSFIDALQSVGLPEDVRHRVIQNALVEYERESGLRVTATAA